MADYPAEIYGFRIRGILGTGAASTIFHAVDPRDGKEYALKQIKKKSEYDQRFLDQAINEYQVSTQLDHPNLRKTYKLLKQRQMLRTTEILLLMEIVRGENLGDAVPDSLRALIRLFRAVSRALHVMHEAGFAHADMKPRNILRSEGAGVKVIDFGQSCPLGTVKTHIQGTPKFIAPEQVKRKAITQQTDIYNLGATMYWAITQTHAPTKMYKPQGAAAPWNGDPDEARRIRAPRELVPDMPSALNSLIMDCLHQRPERRPSSMEQVRARLGLALYQLDRLAERTSRPVPIDPV